MLADKELDQAVAEVAEVRNQSELYHENVAQLIQRYTLLCQEYKRLKSDYEEERESRERYKQLARGQERNPFVLMLVDGDGYVFDDDLISNGAEGGQKAAALLNDVVKSSLRNRGLEHCRIMVRIYANLAGLSKALSKSKLAGPEKRSLAPFTASFTRSNDLFDFVDAGELKENADFKIRAMFRQFAENAQCRHIYFAGCHDVGYLTELTPYVGNRDRITLVRTPTFHHEFSRLGFRIEDFPNIFRTTPLDGQTTISPIQVPTFRPDDAVILPSVETTPMICAYYQKGVCKYGKNCRNHHIKAGPAGANGGSPTATTTNSLWDIREWRQSSGSGVGGGRNILSYPPTSMTRSDNDSLSGSSIAADPAQLRVEFARLLPPPDDTPQNEIPINKFQHRLDAYTPLPSPEDKAAFQARIAVQKLCNNHHINGYCPRGELCEYDHRPITRAMLNCLKHVVRSNPCPRRGACRSATCLHGHLCQKADCQKRGGRAFCKFAMQAHNQPLEPVEYVQGTSGPRDDFDLVPTHWDTSSKASTPPMPEARGLHEESDGEQEPGQGALLDLYGDEASVD